MHRAERPLSLADERVRRAYEAGRRAHPGIEFSYEHFAPYARRTSPPHDNGDYYLAVACDAGAPGAWERLQTRYGKPLRALLRRRGAGRRDVEHLLEDVWGRLASPSPRGDARTRLGTYDGRGPLLAWLSTVAWRRLTDAWRAAAGKARLREGEEAVTAAHADPACLLADGETEQLVAAVLEKAWAALTDRELEVVVLKYRHQMPQNEIARHLRISPPRVTRLLQSATRRLRRSVAARFELRAHAVSAESNQAALLQILQRMLAQSDVRADADGTHGKGTA